MWQLLGSRFVQGMGAGALVPMSFTLLSDLYNYRERARVQAYASSVWGVSSLIGPFIGGLLTDYLHWRLIFLMNLIPGIMTLWFFIRFLPEHKVTEKLKLSPKSFVSSVFGILAFIMCFAFLQRGQYLISAWAALIAFFLFLLFVHYEKNEKFPFIKKEIFSHRIVLASCVTGFLFSGMLIGISSFAPLFFQTVYRYSLTVSGLLICPLSLAWVTGSFFSINLALKYPYKKVIQAGTLLTLTGYILFMSQFGTLDTSGIVLFFMMIGAGMAFNYPVVLVSMQHSVPKNLVGFATATLVWTRNLGSTVITAIMGVVLTLGFENRLRQASIQHKDHDFFKLYIDNPELLLQPSALTHVQVNPVINESFQQSLFAAFLVILIAVILALFASRLFPKRITLSHIDGES